MKSKIILIALVISAYACSHSSTQGDGSVKEVMVGGNKVSVLLLDKVKSGTVTIPLSSLVDDFEMVQLEMHEDAIFGETNKITVTENYIGVLPFSNNYKLFDRSGKFISALSRRGKGPGEFPFSLNDAIIDDKNGIVYLSAFPNKILVYNTSGVYLKEFVIPQPFFDNNQMYLSDGILTAICAPKTFQQPGRTYNAEIMVAKFDVNTGELLEKLPPPFEHLILRSHVGFPNSHQNVPGVFDWVPNYHSLEQSQYDTLYHIDIKRNKFLPFFTVANHLINEGIIASFRQVNKNLMMIQLIKAGAWDPYSEFIVADLSSKTSSRYHKIVNDYLGNLDIPVRTLSNGNGRFINGYFANSIQPEDLMEDIEEHLAESSCTEKDREVLKKTLSKLKEGTNNVVFIGKIKEEIKTNLW